ncbi:MAG: hypothetical protein AB1758_13070 [Candidatus Eremiobacterota bacterium]
MLNDAARDGYRLLPMAWAAQTVAVFERPHEEEEYESMTEEEKARWFADNIEYSRVDSEWHS